MYSHDSVNRRGEISVSTRLLKLGRAQKNRVLSLLLAVFLLASELSLLLAGCIGKYTSGKHKNTAKTAVFSKNQKIIVEDDCPAVPTRLEEWPKFEYSVF